MTTTAAPVSERRVAPAARRPAGVPVARPDLGRLAQPCLSQVQVTPRFRFQEATVLLVESGSLDLATEAHHLRVADSPAVVLVDPRTSADLIKRPGAPDGTFRSSFLEVSSTLLRRFAREHRSGPEPAVGTAPFAHMTLDSDLDDTLRRVVTSIRTGDLSDDRLRYRLYDLLAALHERGRPFRQGTESTADRLRELVAQAPDQRWTADEAGRALAISQATLRRRLQREHARFDELVAEVRMHHGMMLLQTTTWGMDRIAHACGYRSRARFSERFRDRFGYLPSVVR